MSRRQFQFLHLGKFGTWLYCQRHGTCGEIATSQDELKLFYFIFLKHSRGILKINKQIDIFWQNFWHICIIDVTVECVRISSCLLKKLLLNTWQFSDLRNGKPHKGGAEECAGEPRDLPSSRQRQVCISLALYLSIADCLTGRTFLTVSDSVIASLLQPTGQSFYNPSEKRCGSVTFWYDSRSADPCLQLMDPDPVVYKGFSAYYFLKVHSHRFRR